MTGSALILLTMTLVQAAPAPAPHDKFDQLWTGWSAANGQSIEAEKAALEGLRREVAAADAERRRQLMDEGRALGERVGEVVRIGDCTEGERIARQAGDFALVAAVREHCGLEQAPQ